jgi:hypothetical protein
MSIFLKTGFIDLKSVWPKWQAPPAHQEDSAHELRQDHLLPTHGFSLPVRVPQVCRTVWGQLQGQELLPLGPVPMHGLRSTHRRGSPSCGGQVRGGLQLQVAGGEERVCQPTTGPGGMVRGPFSTGCVINKLVSGEPSAVHQLQLFD